MFTLTVTLFTTQDWSCKRVINSISFWTKWTSMESLMEVSMLSTKSHWSKLILGLRALSLLWAWFLLKMDLVCGSLTMTKKLSLETSRLSLRILTLMTSLNLCLKLLMLLYRMHLMQFCQISVVNLTYSIPSLQVNQLTQMSFWRKCSEPKWSLMLPFHPRSNLYMRTSWSLSMLLSSTLLWKLPMLPEK